MRTLDEVIKAVEEDLECANESYPEVFYDYDNHKDALHYLKEFKRISARLEKIALGNITETLEKLDNPALTWDELKQMEGKPVWVEYISCKRKVWAIVDCFYTDAFGKVNMNVALPHDYWHLEKELIGKAWQAYRKGRS